MSYSNYAVLLEKLERYDEAEEHYGPSRGGPHKRAIVLNPGDADWCDNLYKNYFRRYVLFQN